MHQHANSLCFIFGIIYSTAISTQLHQTSFIDEPRSPVFAEPNATAEFVWKMKNCILNSYWRVKLLTEQYDLYPIPHGPIKTITDYNVTAKCRDNSTIVTLSIVFNENVLENAEYIMCRVRRLGEDSKIVLTHIVNFTTIKPTTNPNPSTETTSNSESSSIIQSTDIMTVTVMSTSGSGCKQRVHFSALVLCFIVANFLRLAFSWKSCYFF